MKIGGITRLIDFGGIVKRRCWIASAFNKSADWLNTFVYLEIYQIPIVQPTCLSALDRFYCGFARRERTRSTPNERPCRLNRFIEQTKLEEERLLQSLKRTTPTYLLNHAR